MRLVPSAGYHYLASPYSSPDPFVRELRYLRATMAVTEALKQGVYLYSPIVHCHELAKIADLPRNFEFWQKYNHVMLASAESVWILMLPGWQDSRGIADEILKAKSIPLRVSYIEPKEAP